MERERVRRMDDELTEDVTEEVMLRLPVRSLLRFRCVCKRWRALIDSNAFVKKHTNLSSLQIKSNHTNHLVFVTYYPEPHPFRYDSNAKLYSLKGLYSCVPFSQQLVLPLTRPTILIRLRGSCNGLLCIEFCHGEYQDLRFILNTATQKHLKLPPQKIRNVLAHGFGYDSVSDDYKMVALTCSKTYVYTLRSNSWRNFGVGDFLKIHISYFQHTGALACGVIHWIRAMRDPFGFDTILAFDLATETYMIITLPDLRHDDDDEVSSLAASELGGCLSIVCKHPNNVGVFDVWVMKDYGVRESWTKLLTLSCSEIDRPIILFVFPLAYLESGDQVLFSLHFQKSKKTLFWFNLEKRIVKLVEVREDLFTLPVICFESLVSLGDKAETTRGEV